MRQYKPPTPVGGAVTACPRAPAWGASTDLQAPHASGGCRDGLPNRDPTPHAAWPSRDPTPHYVGGFVRDCAQALHHAEHTGGV